MNTKERLTPQQQAERIEGLYKNLERQAQKIFRNDRSGSIDTRKPYFAAEKRFCRFLAENYSLQNLKNVEPRHFYAFAEDMKAKGLSTSYIYATLSAIRYYNDKLGGKNEMPNDFLFHMTPDCRFDMTARFFHACGVFRLSAV